MAMLAEAVELVIGSTPTSTPTPRRSLPQPPAWCHPGEVPATPAGYQQLLGLADRHHGRRVWAIEGTGGYGAGLTRFLQATPNRW